MDEILNFLLQVHVYTFIYKYNFFYLCLEIIKNRNIALLLANAKRIPRIIQMLTMCT